MTDLYLKPHAPFKWPSDKHRCHRLSSLTPFPRPCKQAWRKPKLVAVGDGQSGICLRWSPPVCQWIRTVHIKDQRKPCFSVLYMGGGCIDVARDNGLLFFRAVDCPMGTYGTVKYSLASLPYITKEYYGIYYKVSVCWLQMVTPQFVATFDNCYFWPINCRSQEFLHLFPEDEAGHVVESGLFLDSIFLECPKFQRGCVLFAGLWHVTRPPPVGCPVDLSKKPAHWVMARGPLGISVRRLARRIWLFVDFIYRKACISPTRELRVACNKKQWKLIQIII